MRLTRSAKIASVLLLAVFICGAAISIAIAQSGGSFSLNSPASFPVDI